LTIASWLSRVGQLLGCLTQAEKNPLNLTQVMLAEERVPR